LPAGSGTIRGRTGDAMIEFRDVSKTYPGSDTSVVNHLSFEVPEGEICVLVGPSGCGKTTTMRMVNRLIEPTDGDILIEGEPNTAMSGTQLRRKIGYAIQQIGLFPHRTIATNIATVPSLLGWNKQRIGERVDELLELVGLDPNDYRDRYPAELSGGQQQRVGVARAMAADPPIMLMDEPFGAVDPITRERLQDEFLNIQQNIKKTIVFVTHDIDEAIKMGDKIAILKQGGFLAQYDTPENILANPNSEFVASFVGNDRILKRLSLTRVGDMELEPANGNAEDLPRISGNLTVKDALSALIGSGRTEAVVENDGEKRLLTIDAIEELSRAGGDSRGSPRRLRPGATPGPLLDRGAEAHRVGLDPRELLGGHRARDPGPHLPLVRLGGDSARDLAPHRRAGLTLPQSLPAGDLCYRHPLLHTEPGPLRHPHLHPRHYDRADTGDHRARGLLPPCPDPQHRSGARRGTGRDHRRRARDGPDEPPDPLQGRVPAGAAGDRGRHPHCDGDDNRDRDHRRLHRRRRPGEDDLRRHQPQLPHHDHHRRRSRDSPRHRRRPRTPGLLRAALAAHPSLGGRATHRHRHSAARGARYKEHASGRSARR